MTGDWGSLKGLARADGWFEQIRAGEDILRTGVLFLKDSVEAKACESSANRTE